MNGNGLGKEREGFLSKSVYFYDSNLLRDGTISFCFNCHGPKYLLDVLWYMEE